MTNASEIQKKETGVEACFFTFASRVVGSRITGTLFFRSFILTQTLPPISSASLTLAKRLRIHLIIFISFSLLLYIYLLSQSILLGVRVLISSPYNILTASSLLWNSSSQDWYLCPLGGPAIVLLRKKRVTLLAPLQWPAIHIDNPSLLLILLIHPASASLSTTAEKTNTYEHSRPSSFGTTATQ